MGEKISSISARDLVKVFEEFGFKVTRQKGSHILITKEGSRTICYSGI